MYTQAEINLMQETLVTSVSCGDSKLSKLLQDSVGLIWLMSQSCTPELQYLNSQLELIALAQGFTRNMIDETHRNSSSRAQDKFDSANYRDTQSQRTGQGTSASWSKATAFQQFQRDSAQHARNQSDSNSDTTGHSSSYLWDRSQQVNTGWANTYDISKTKSHDEFLSQSGTCVDRESQAAGGTPAPPNAVDVSGTIAPTLNFFAYSGWGQQVMDFFSNWLTSTIWGGTSVKAPDGPPTWTTTNAVTFVPGLTDPPCSDDPESKECNPLISFGAGFRDSWNTSVAIPFVGTVASTWQDGSDFRQSFTCHHGNSTLKGSSFEQSNGRGEMIGESMGETQAHSEGENVHDRHRSASAYRNSEGHASASATDIMRAHGEAHNGSDSSAHGESQAGNQSTAYGVSHMEGHGTAFSHSESEATTRYWSQIFKSLADMWARVWQEIRELEDLLATSKISYAKLPNTCTACDARNRAFISRTSVPALGRVPRVTTPFYSMGVIQ